MRMETAIKRNFDIEERFERRHVLSLLNLYQSWQEKGLDKNPMIGRLCKSWYSRSLAHLKDRLSRV